MSGKTPYRIGSRRLQPAPAVGSRRLQPAPAPFRRGIPVMVRGLRITLAILCDAIDTGLRSLKAAATATVAAPATALFLIFALTTAFLSNKSFAQDSKYAGAFLEIPVGSHALGMGGAFTAIANDESAFHWNPAGVSLIDHKLAGFMYSSEYGTPGSALANFYQIGFTYPMKELTLAANWERLSIGDLVHTPDLTNVTVTDQRAQLVREIYAGSPDYFSDNEDAIVLSVARDNRYTLDWGWLYYKQEIEVPVGVNFKIIHQGIGSFGSASGIGIDAGAMLKFSVADFLLMPYLGNISLAVAVTDIGGTRLAWSTQRTQIIPMHVNGGVAYTQPLPLLNTVATISSDFLLGETEQARIGMDVQYDSVVSLRVGINRGFFAAGAGFIWQKKVTVGYSLSINDALGPEHRLSFSVDIDNALKKEGGNE